MGKHKGILQICKETIADYAWEPFYLKQNWNCTDQTWEGVFYSHEKETMILVAILILSVVWTSLLFDHLLT